MSEEYLPSEMDEDESAAYDRAADLICEYIEGF